MEFCNFVPPAARSFILEMINGEPSKRDGLQRLADKAKEQLDQLLKKNQAKVEQGKLLSEAAVREQRRAEAHYKQLLGDLDAVQRLGTDLQMEPAYRALKKSSDEDETLRRFLYAAWGARIDFLRYRDALDRATILSEEIAVDAENLSTKIRDLFETFHDTPLELHSISELLRQTDNNELDGHNQGMWRIHRGVILGDPPLEARGSWPTEAAKELEPSSTTPEQLYQRDLRYAWGVAPDFAELLSQVSKTMRNFVPKQHGYIGAGVNLRQDNEKTAYIRGLYKLLKDEHGIKVDLPIRQAIAAVTIVMLNKLDMHVTTEDVTKALKYYEKRG